MIPVSDKVFLVESHKAEHPYCNCLLINDEVRVLIDNSCGRKKASSLANSGIDILINSHFHIDHTMNNDLFVDSQVWAHELDAPAIRDPIVGMEMAGFFEYQHDEIAYSFIDSHRMKPGKVNKYIVDGEVLDLGSTKIKVLHAPGHTPGHCVFWADDLEMLFSVDITLSAQGPWIANSCSRISDYISTIKMCQSLHPKIVIPGHDDIITENIPERFSDFLAKLFLDVEKVLLELKTPLTFSQLVDKQLFWGKGWIPYREFFLFFEETTIANHLTYLIEQNLVKHVDGIYFRC